MLLLVGGQVWGQDTVTIYTNDTIKVLIIEKKDKVSKSLDTLDWCDYKKVGLYYWITEVESTNNGFLKITGYKTLQSKETSSFIFRFSDRNKIFSITTRKLSFPGTVSLVTVPFKTRYPNKYIDYSQSYAKLDNVGLNFGIYKPFKDRYFYDGHKSQHALEFGFLLSPFIEEIDEDNTKPNFNVDRTSNQIFISAGITATYTYNDLTFIIVPFGLDIGLTSTASSWIYNNKPWIGFGIGISPKIFAQKLNTEK